MFGFTGAGPFVIILNKKDNIKFISIPFLFTYSNTEKDVSDYIGDESSIIIHLGFLSGLLRFKKKSYNYDIPETLFGRVEHELVETGKTTVVTTNLGEFVVVEGQAIFKRSRRKKVLERTSVYIFKKAPINIRKNLNYVQALSPEHAVVRIQEVVNIVNQLQKDFDLKE